MDLTVRFDKIIEKDSPVKAVCSVTLDEAFTVHGVKVIESSKGEFVGMPFESFKDAEGNTKRRDLFHPITAQARAELDETVLTAYRALMKMKADAEPAD